MDANYDFKELLTVFTTADDVNPFIQILNDGAEALGRIRLHEDYLSSLGL
jgi:hypothetical protein